MKFALFVALMLAPGLQAQGVGDKVKVRDRGIWVEGVVEHFEPDGRLYIRDKPWEQGFGFQVSAIDEADWYKDRPLALDVLLGVAGAVTLEAVLSCSPEGGTVRLRCWSDDRGTQYAIQAAIGATIGLIMHAIKPGRWTSWIENGLVIR